MLRSFRGYVGAFGRHERAINLEQDESEPEFKLDVRELAQPEVDAMAK